MLVTGVAVRLYAGLDLILPLAAAGSIFIFGFLVNHFYRKTRHLDGIGGGDIKFAAALAVLFSVDVIAVIYVSSLLAIIFAISGRFLFRRAFHEIPLMPFFTVSLVLYGVMLSLLAIEPGSLLLTLYAQ
jgi:Flp pilus assembly protein protease CpaA